MSDFASCLLLPGRSARSWWNPGCGVGRYYLSPGFVSIERLALELFPYALQPTAQTGGSLLATLVGGEKKSVGNVGLLVGVDGESEAENSTLRITISVL